MIFVICYIYAAPDKKQKFNLKKYAFCFGKPSTPKREERQQEVT